MKCLYWLVSVVIKISIMKHEFLSGMIPIILPFSKTFMLDRYSKFYWRVKYVSGVAIVILHKIKFQTKVQHFLVYMTVAFLVNLGCI